MKKCIGLFFLASVLCLLSCSGSDVYRGTWKATDTEGNKFEITFEPKLFTIKEGSGKVTTYEYTQNSVKIENSIKTYGIHLSDGRRFNLFFPLANDPGKAVITLENNAPVFTISRTSYIQYKDLYQLTP